MQFYGVVRVLGFFAKREWCRLEAIPTRYPKRCIEQCKLLANQEAACVYCCQLKGGGVIMTRLKSDEAAARHQTGVKREYDSFDT